MNFCSPIVILQQVGERRKQIQLLSIERKSNDLNTRSHRSSQVGLEYHNSVGHGCLNSTPYIDILVLSNICLLWEEAGI